MNNITEVITEVIEALPQCGSVVGCNYFQTFFLFFLFMIVGIFAWLLCNRLIRSSHNLNKESKNE